LLLSTAVVATGTVFVLGTATLAVRIVTLLHLASFPSVGQMIPAPPVTRTGQSGKRHSQIRGSGVTVRTP
jgi:hypothetical protein